MKNNQKNLAIILFLALIVPAAMAQSKWDKILVKAADKYEIGDYPSARKQIDKLKKGVVKKLGTSNKYMAIAFIQEAKYDVALGLLGVVEQSVNSGLDMSKEVNGESSSDHAFILKEAAEALVQYGNLVKAQEYLTQAYSILEENGDLKDDVKASLEVVQAQIDVGRGFYSKALGLINNRMEYFRERTRNPAVDKKENRTRKREFAYMMMFKGDAFRRMGDYLRADSSFVYANKWIIKNLGKADILYSQNQFMNTLLLEENGLDKGAVVDLYEKAYLHTVRKYAPSHYVTVQIQERLIKSYLRNDNRAKLNNISTEFKKTVKKYYGRRSINGIILETLDYDVLSGNQRAKGLEEDVNEILASEEIIPKYHPKRIEFLEFANKVALLHGSHENSYNYLSEILDIKAELYGEESPEYNLTKTKMANYYVDFTEKFDEAAEIYQKSFHEIVEKEITEGHLDYVDILDHLAVFYEQNDQYDKSSKILAIALEASRRKYDDQDIEYAIELDKIANLQFKIGEYEKAEDNILEAIEILKDAKEESAQSYYAQSLITEATLLAIKGEYDAAEENIVRSERLKSRGVKTIETSGIDTEDELAEVYLDIGRYHDAEDLIDATLDKKEERFGAASRHLNDPLLLSSRHKMIVGDYTEAEKRARRAYNITTSIFGMESSKITSSMLQLARIYTVIGDYDQAKILLEDVIKIRKVQFGDQHVDVARAISDLALVKYYNNEELVEIEELFLQAERIIGKKLGGSNPYYAEILKNLATVYIAEGRYNEAFTFLDDAGRIWNKKIGKRNNINAATINILKGDIYYKRKEYNQADDYYQDAKKLYERFFNDSHPEYVKVLSKLSKTYFMQGDIKRAQSSLEEVLANYNLFIKDYFPALSEREKAKFWNTIKQDYEFYNTLVISHNRNEDLIGKLYDNALLTKALLLNSSIKIRQRILQSGDEELKGLYNDWLSKKELLTYVLSMSTDQLEENGVDPEALNKEVELLEKQLSEKSEDFSSGFENQVITWKEVKESLNPDEVALEMIRFRVFDHNFTDSVMYAVLYVKNTGKRSKPQLILLNNGQDLETKYLKFYRNSIKYKLDDTYSYKNFWQPIQEAIGAPSTIYLSADGVYNQINLESIALDDGSYVLDRSNIVLVSNTKDLFTNKLKSKAVQEANIAMMFGDPTFYIKSEPGRWAGRASTTRGGNPDVIGQLPGTQEEVKELKDLLRGNGWVTKEYMNEAAVEDLVKKVDNPKIFHIATHGFFQPDVELNTGDLGLNENLAAENPLLKTGLLLAGAGDILNQTTSNYNIEDGILTAYEAMNLNLDKTDLVVLSACETGLGELEAGEGVYGLQRAFLVAGARTIIMSLFKVSDEATQKLMVKFYSKWLETGNKRASFIEAKKEIRQEYRDPIYWGPFIMIGLDE